MAAHRRAKMTQPGRRCPLSYRYAPSSLATTPAIVAQTLYVIGGLYGNRQALDWIEARSAREPGPVTLVFNGDFHWFDVDRAVFDAINRTVLDPRYMALRGNVETEIAGEDGGAGCGCGYPEFVSDAEVERSNRIIERLRETARSLPGERSRLGALPVRLAVEVAGVRIGIVHGDAGSLAGWGFSQEALRDPPQRAAAAAWFGAAGVRVFASSHTCLPVMQAFHTPRGRCLLANNGAAGMPNFSGTRYGLLTRISATPARDALYGASIEGVRIEALPVPYDHAGFERDFLASWPAGSPAHESYYRRIMEGPAYRPDDAVRLKSPATA
ncbi:MAG TPA: hypothetical protein VFO57_06785 [Burkholderiales bacterium]|nr:hypothetical protein [Burkholderiales bacterium]